MSNKPIVSIFTGNSNSGSYCIKELFERYPNKLHVRGVFRSKEKAAPFQQKYPDLEIVTDVDASKPETMTKAFKGANYALIVTPLDYSKGFSDDANLTENMINSAVENGVTYIVVVGSLTCHFPDVCPMISNRFLGPEKLLEKLGKEKNIKWTVLRGGFFMENLIMIFRDSIKNESSIRFPNCYIPAVDTKDIGKSGAACFVSNIDEHNRKYYDMTGPEFNTGPEMAKTLSKVLGKEIKYIEQTLEDVRKLPVPYNQLYEYMVQKGKQATPYTDDVKRLTGQHGTFEQFVIDHIDSFR